MAAPTPAGATASQPAARPVLVVDYGAQYAQLITRRVREAGLYAELVPTTSRSRSCWRVTPRPSCCPAGPPRSMRRTRPRSIPTARGGVPVFGICYGFQLMARALGGTVARTGTAEYGGDAARGHGSGRGALRRACRTTVGVDVPRRRGDRRTARASSSRHAPRRRPSRRSRIVTAARRRAVPSRGPPLRARTGRARALPVRRRGLEVAGTRQASSPSRSRRASAGR
jgi:hypothetical protein